MGLPRQHPTTIENLPGELLSEILIRVPSKPLAQMRSVSKPWNHLLSQPSFIKSHLHRSLHNNNNNNDEILLVLLSGSNDKSFSFTAHLSRSPHLKLELPDFIKFPDSPPPKLDSITFFGSVNGLICYGFRTDRNDYVIQIWNPSLSALLTLPPFNGPYWFPIDDYYLELHFRFGYDPKTDDYKLVKLMSYSLPPNYLIDYSARTAMSQPKWLFNNSANDVKEVEVYSMRNGSWKLIGNRFPSHIRAIVDEEVVCVDGHDGCLHWLGSTFNGNKQMIVTFDLGVEAFGEIPLPNSVVGFNRRRWNGLGFYSGKLCVMSFKKGYEYEVWVMNEYGVAESWTKLRIFSDFGDDIDPHGFTTSNKFLFSSRISADWRGYTFYGQLNIYDPDADEVKSFETDARDGVWTKVVRYVESLVWVAPTN